LSRGGFNWKNASNHLLWSASVNGQNLITIGFGNSKNDFERAKSANNAQIQQSLLTLIMQYEDSTLEKRSFLPILTLNLIDVVITRRNPHRLAQKQPDPLH
jgi:DeoR/GlpR family transcriptional regulator of sugar metabolism